MNSKFLFVAAITLAGCSSSSTSSTDGGSSQDTGASSDSGGTVDGSSSGMDSGDAAAMPAKPQLLSAEPLGGGLHVMWKLNDTGLTAVHLMRKKDAGAYAMAYTLPGSATSQHDAAATAPGMYCYQVQTMRGDAMSDLSNEVCGTP